MFNRQLTQEQREIEDNASILGKRVAYLESELGYSRHSHKGYGLFLGLEYTLKSKVKVLTEQNETLKAHVQALCNYLDVKIEYVPASEGYYTVVRKEA